MTSPFSFSILILLIDNKRFDRPWGWYLIILETVVFPKFAKFKYFRIRQCLFLNVFEPPYLILQSFNFTTLRQYLLKKQGTFYPLTCTYICKQRTLAMVFLLFIVYRSCECRNWRVRPANIVYYEKLFLSHYF